MRSFLLALAACLVLAGCASNNDANTTTTSTPVTSTPAGGGNMSGGMQVASDNHDFTTGGTPAGGAASKAVEVPAGHSNLNLTVKFSPAGPVGVATGVTVKVAGLTCALPDGPVTGSVTCNKTGPVTAGPAKIEYAGTGPVSAAVTLMAE